MPSGARTVILAIGTVGSLAYAFIPPGHPEWVGTAAALLGGEVLARAPHDK